MKDEIGKIKEKLDTLMIRLPPVQKKPRMEGKIDCYFCEMWPIVRYTLSVKYSVSCVGLFVSRKTNWFRVSLHEPASDISAHHSFVDGGGRGGGGEGLARSPRSRFLQLSSREATGMNTLVRLTEENFF